MSVSPTPATCHYYYLIIIIVLALLQIDLTNGTLCYTSNGDVSNDVPCNDTGAASVCCTQGFLCTSNGLCQPEGWWDGTTGNKLQFIRGTCSDKTWSSPACFGHCVAESMGGGEWVMRCGANSNNYCCSADDCCNRSSSFPQFTLGNPTITATAGFEAGYTSSAVSSLSGSIAAPTPIFINSTFANSTSSSSTGNATASVPSSSSGHSQTNTSTIIGLVVGLGVGLFLLGCLVSFLFFRTQRKRSIKSAAMQNVSIVSEPVNTIWGELEHPSCIAELDGTRTTRSEML